MSIITGWMSLLSLWVLFGFAAGQMGWTDLSSAAFFTNASLALCHTFPMPVLPGPRMPGLSHKMTLWLSSHTSLKMLLLRKLRSSVYNKKQLLLISWARGSFLLCSQELARERGNGIDCLGLSTLATNLTPNYLLVVSKSAFIRIT